MANYCVVLGNSCAYQMVIEVFICINFLGKKNEWNKIVGQKSPVFFRIRNLALIVATLQARLAPVNAANYTLLLDPKYIQDLIAAASDNERSPGRPIWTIDIYDLCLTLGLIFIMTIFGIYVWWIHYYRNRHQSALRDGETQVVSTSETSVQFDESYIQ